MRAIVLMFDSLNRHMLPPYVADALVHAPNFARLADRAVRFDNFYAGSMPCIPARRELHTGRYNFLHRSWGPLEPFDDSVPEILDRAGIHTHLASDHPHYWEDGGATYHTRFTTWEFIRGQEGDPWKGLVAGAEHNAGPRSKAYRQDQINRSYMPTESDHSQTRTVDAGLHFLEQNADADRWMLHLELFDPHEPFFVHKQYNDLYPGDESAELDWPEYRKVTEDPEVVERTRRQYAALVSMCDHSLGRVLDAMDAHDMWDDTMLIVNTDHGFLLGEHGWWAKSVQPWYNELVRLPMFLWDPRSGQRAVRRTALTQTIDLAPTLLRYFGIGPTPDMQGKDLATVLAEDRAVRDGALFGIHGGHVNVTDGRYVYMRSSQTAENRPLEDHTLMPTHMRARFSVSELEAWEPAEPMSFTKGLRTMRVPVHDTWLEPWTYGSLLFDLRDDPGQENPIVDDEAELRMMRLLVDLMRANDAPASQYERIGLPRDGDVEERHLHVRDHIRRATALAEPLPRPQDLLHHELLSMPLVELLEDHRARASIQAHAPGLTSTEMVNVPSRTSLLDLAARATISTEVLRLIDRDLRTRVD